MKLHHRIPTRAMSPTPPSRDIQRRRNGGVRSVIIQEYNVSLLVTNMVFGQWLSIKDFIENVSIVRIIISALVSQSGAVMLNALIKKLRLNTTNEFIIL
jgi:hypothetical protein